MTFQAAHGPGPASAQRVGVGLAELQAPPPDGFVGDEHAAPGHQLLDLAERQRKPVVQPHAVGDDLDGVPVPRYDGDTDDTNEPLPGTTNFKIISGRSANVTTPDGRL